MKYLRILILIAVCSPATAAGLLRRDFDFSHASYTVKDTDTIIRKQSLSVGINYGSDAMFFGRVGPITYPYFSSDVVYNFKSGFFVYGSALRLLGYNTSVDEVDVGGGYLYHPTRQFSGAISYNRFIFNKEERIIESATSNDVNWKNSFDWGAVKSTATVDYLFGKSSDFFLTVTHSKYFETKGNIFDDKDYLSFNPAFSFIIGTQNFVERYSLDHQDRANADNIYRLGPGSSSDFNNGRLNMLNYSFKVPIAYNRPHYTLELSYKYSIPVNVEGALENKHESFISASFFYVFY
ncbi:hypothetical protein [Mucilaginibacter sp. dw_454]|uniref:hypothetical protein n=1 Tax=Mucilaginibacter sp. dw_454 TaxID=2720079 RepID=UPI001BD22E3A|nr:hypothetical protein [Mucilaginibacter sp. dw_454]